MDLYLELADLLSVQENPEKFELFQVLLKLMSITPCGPNKSYKVLLPVTTLKLSQILYSHDQYNRVRLGSRTCISVKTNSVRLKH